MPHLPAHMSTAVLCRARRGDAGAFCPKRPRSFPVASRREATATTLLDPLSFPSQGESTLMSSLAVGVYLLDGQTHAHNHAYVLIHARAHARLSCTDTHASADTCVRTGIHSRKRTLKCAHTVTRIHTLTLIDIHTQGHALTQHAHSCGCAERGRMMRCACLGASQS